MSRIAIVTNVISAVVGVTALSFAIYTFTQTFGTEKTGAVRGRVGPEGRPGDNGTCDETVAYNLLGLYNQLNETAYSFDFCTTETCDILTLLVNDAEQIVSDSNLRGVNLIPLENDIEEIYNITSNGTFCPSETCAYHELILTELVETFGGGDQIGLLANVSTILGELEAIVSNDTFAKYPITDESFEDGSLSISKLTGPDPNGVVITDGDSLLTTTPILSTSLGGTGKDSSAWTGIAYVEAGDWRVNTTISYDALSLTSSIIDSDISSSANISRLKISTGNPDYVVITNNNGRLTDIQYVPPSLGGFGVDMSSASGYVLWNAGAVSTVAEIARDYIGSGNPNYVVINSAGGYLTDEQRLSTTRGGTGINSASLSGYVKITNGVWGVGATNLTYNEVNLTNSIVNADVATGANIARSKLASGTASHVLINDGSGVMSSEARLATTRGGTNADSSAWTGFAYVSAGSWQAITPITSSYFNLTNSITDNDISTSAAIQRTKMAAGTASHVLINDGSGLLSSEAQLAPSRGGTGIDTSASTGFPKITSGTWSVVSSIGYSSLSLSGSIVNSDISTSANISRSKIQTSSGNYVVINDGTGALSVEQRLANSRGGTGQDSSAWNNVIPLVTSGTWSAGITYITSGGYSPVITFGGGSTGITYTTQLGIYVRIGGIVITDVNILLSSKGSSTGQARVSLPIAAYSPSTGGNAPVLTDNFDLAANYYAVFVVPESGVATALFATAGDNNAATISTDAAFSATTSIRFTLMYSV